MSDKKKPCTHCMLTNSYYKRWYDKGTHYKDNYMLCPNCGIKYSSIPHKSNTEKHNDIMIQRPHRIIFYNIHGNVSHTDTFATMEDASRTYNNIRELIKEKNGKIHSGLTRIILSTVYSETYI